MKIESLSMELVPRFVELAIRHLASSLEDVEEYEELTDREKEIISREDFERLKAKPRREIKPGEVIVHEGVKLMCVEATCESCEGCFFLNWESGDCERPNEYGFCAASYRDDGKDVNFILA